MKLKLLDLFSGLGGFSLGLERTGCFKTIAFCDNNKFSKLILDKHWKGTKIYDDIREITKEKFKTDGIESPDIITGGFPCQPFSVAGKQKGTSDDRHLWPEMFRIIKAFKPRFVIGENVRGIINIQDGVVFEAVCTDLESEGYEVQPFIIPAAGVGAPHRRERVWIIAIREESMVNSDNIRFEQHIETEEEASRRRSSATFESTSNVGNTQYDGSSTTKIGRGNEEVDGRTEKRQNSSSEFERTSRSGDNGNLSKNVADTESSLGNDIQAVAGTSGSTTQEVSGNGSSVRGESAWWDFEPDVGRVAHGIPGRVYRLKGLGNSIIPQIAQEIGNAIIKAEGEE